MIFTLFAKRVLAVKFCEANNVVHAHGTPSFPNMCVGSFSKMRGAGSFPKICGADSFPNIGGTGSCSKHFQFLKKTEVNINPFFPLFHKA